MASLGSKASWRKLDDLGGCWGSCVTTIPARRRPLRGVGPCGFLLLMATLLHRSTAAGSFFKGSQGGNAPPGRPPTSPASRSENEILQSGGGGGGGGNGRGPALSPAMYTRIVGSSTADASGRREGLASMGAGAGAGVRGAGGAPGAAAAVGGRDIGAFERLHEQRQQRQQEREQRQGQAALRSNNDVDEDRRSGGENRGPTLSGRTPATLASAGIGAGANAGERAAAGQRRGSLSPEIAVRRKAFLAVGRASSSGRRAVLEPRAGALGRVGEGGGGAAAFKQYRQQQQQQQQQQRDEQQAFASNDRWDAGGDDNVFDYDREPNREADGAPRMVMGMEVSDGASGPPLSPPPPPRSPLQEQAYQNSYRNQHTQIPGQAVGTTQPASSSLFRRAGSGGVFFIFVILVCRALNHYEHADNMVGALRAFSMVPAVGLFLGNMVCMCLSLVQSVTSRQKARMKTMLTVNAFSELVLLGYNMLLLLVGTTAFPKEEFVSRMLTNVLFMSLCFTFAKARWVADGTF